MFLFAVCLNLCGQAAEASLERERYTLVETRTDLVQRAEGAEKRCESLQCSTKELTQKLRDTERRFQKVDNSRNRGFSPHQNWGCCGSFYTYTLFRPSFNTQCFSHRSGSIGNAVVSIRINYPNADSNRLGINTAKAPTKVNRERQNPPQKPRC